MKIFSKLKRKENGPNQKIVIRFHGREEPSLGEKASDEVAVEAGGKGCKSRGTYRHESGN